MGSASETEYHLLLAHDLGYLDNGSYQELDTKLKEMKQMLNALITRLKVVG